MAISTVFAVTKPRWRLGPAVAKFDCVSLEELSMYYLPGFEDWSKRALSWIAGTLDRWYY
ncbi:MAG: hypothetical protein GX322_05465 [Firmicutes bacterium]|nr:hypothetical protein [Bacillota bacterium]